MLNDLSIQEQRAAASEAVSHNNRPNDFMNQVTSVPSIGANGLNTLIFKGGTSVIAFPKDPMVTWIYFDNSRYYEYRLSYLGAILMHKGTPFRNESIEWRFVFSTSTDGKIKAWLYGNICSRVSTTGLEASGTSNMKFDMNGCIQIGTLDGANVEIRQEVGEDNFFLFGDEAHEIDGLQKERSEGKFVPDLILEEVKEYVRSGVFGPYSYNKLMGSLEGTEGYGCADYFPVGKYLQGS
ncbi:starch phosphorylase1 [Tanacetum coccineum]